MRSTGEREDGAPNVYRPFQQDSRARMYLVGRGGADPAALATPLRQAVWSIDPDLPIDAIQTMERAIYLQSATSYALITLFLTFAVLAEAEYLVGVGRLLLV